MKTKCCGKFYSHHGLLVHRAVNKNHQVSVEPLKYYKVAPTICIEMITTSKDLALSFGKEIEYLQ